MTGHGSCGGGHSTNLYIKAFVYSERGPSILDINGSSYEPHQGVVSQPTLAIQAKLIKALAPFPQ